MATKYSQEQDGEKSAIFIYCLTFPSGKSYVGITIHPDLRFRQHQTRAEAGAMYAVNHAWRKYGDPEMKLLAEAPHYEAAFSLEKKYIRELKTKSPHGYNLTDGGEGIVGRTEESLKKQGRKTSLKYKTDPEFREKMHAKSIKAGPKVSAANKKFYATKRGREVMRNRSKSDWRKNITISNQNQITSETRGKLKMAIEHRWQDPEYREKVNKAREAKQAELRANNPDWVKKKAVKMSGAMKEKWQDPEYLAKMAKRKPPVLSLEQRQAIWEKRRASWSPERRAILGAQGKSRYWKVKMLKALALQGKS